MGTLRRFPNPPALWLRQAKPAFANAIIMGTLRRFPNPPALWLRQAKPAFANAIPYWRMCGAGDRHFVSLCSVCFRQRPQYFDNFSFSALARLFLVVE
jgi:hypothetical protein